MINSLVELLGEDLTQHLPSWVLHQTMANILYRRWKEDRSVRGNHNQKIPELFCPFTLLKDESNRRKKDVVFYAKNIHPQWVPALQSVVEGEYRRLEYDEEITSVRPSRDFSWMVRVGWSVWTNEEIREIRAVCEFARDWTYANSNASYDPSHYPMVWDGVVWVQARFWNDCVSHKPIPKSRVRSYAKHMLHLQPTIYYTGYAVDDLLALWECRA